MHPLHSYKIKIVRDSLHVTTCIYRKIWTQVKSKFKEKKRLLFTFSLYWGYIKFIRRRISNYHTLFNFMSKALWERILSKNLFIKLEPTLFVNSLNFTITKGKDILIIYCDILMVWFYWYKSSKSNSVQKPLHIGVSCNLETYF